VHIFAFSGFTGVTALPVLLKRPTVNTSSDGRYLMIQWPEWLLNTTGNGTGPVVSYTLQCLAQLDDADWQNLVTLYQHSLSTRWFSHVAKG